jgi:hypothetical protein
MVRKQLRKTGNVVVRGEQLGTIPHPNSWGIYLYSGREYSSRHCSSLFMWGSPAQQLGKYPITPGEKYAQNKRINFNLGEKNFQQLKILASQQHTKYSHTTAGVYRTTTTTGNINKISEISYNISLGYITVTHSTAVLEMST